MFFWLFTAFVILQRITELFIAGRNEKILFSKGALEFDKGWYKYIAMMHTGFFISLITEHLILKSELNPYWLIFLIIFVLAQILRYWSIMSLGHYWNTKIIVSKTGELVKKGPYKYFNHPNYAAVISELAVIPLVFSCYITFLVFSVLNIFVLKRRIKIENEALKLYIKKF